MERSIYSKRVEDDESLTDQQVVEFDLDAHGDSQGLI